MSTKWARCQLTNSMQSLITAIERVGHNRQNEKLSELFARLYILVIGEVGITEGAFEKVSFLF